MNSNLSKTTFSPLWIFLKGLLIGSFSLGIFYVLLFGMVTKSLSHPFSQFLAYQPWMSLLIIGFGVQIGLYQLLKNGFHLGKRMQDAKITTGTSSAISGTSMVLCCLHHLVDLVPILGLSALASVLSYYQTTFLVFGVITNVVGIILIFMLLWGAKLPASHLLNTLHRSRAHES